MLIYLFIIGFVSLVYEILWIRLLSDSIGSELNTTTLIISGYLFGLALGYFLSFKFGKKDFAKIFLINILIAVYSFFSVKLFNIINLFQSDLLCFLVTFFLCLMPFFVFGLTLTFLINNLSSDDAGYKTSLLYGIFNFGCVFGCLISGYVLLYHVGIKKSVHIISLIYLILSVYFGIKVKIKSVLEGDKIYESNKNFLNLLPLILILLSGFSSLSYEILWIRFFKTIFGSSNITITLIFAIYIVGLTSGNIFYHFFYYKLKGYINSKTFAISQFILGIYILLSLIFMPYIPFFLLQFVKILGEGYLFIQIIYFVLLLPFVFIPTFLFGIIFPLFLDSFCDDKIDIKKFISYSFAINTIGSVLGIFVTNFALISIAGVKNSFIIIAFVNFIIALFVFIKDFKKVLTGGLLFIFALVLSVSFRWDKRVFSAGFYIYRDFFKSGDILEMINLFNKFYDRIVYYAEGKHFDVAVIENKKRELFLKIDGKADASIGRGGDMLTQVLSAHIPLMIANKDDDILLIGLGSGITAGEIIKVKGLAKSRIDVCEIEPRVIDAAGYFSKYNYNITKEKKVNFILKDARAYLNRTKKKYDIIISEPTNIWVSGSGHLFSYEFFKIVKNALKNEGIYAQWLQVYDISFNSIKGIIKTFFSVYPYGYIFTTDNVMGDLLLIGSNTPIEITKLFERYSYYSDNLRLLDITSLEEIMKRYIADSTHIMSLVKDAPIVLDDRPKIELDVTKMIFLPTPKRQKNTDKNIEFLKNITKPISLNRDYLLKYKINIVFLISEYLGSGKFPAANELFNSYYDILPQYFKSYFNGIVFLNKGKIKEAEIEFKKSVKLNSNWIPALVNLFELSLKKGDNYWIWFNKIKSISIKEKNDLLLFSLYHISLRYGVVDVAMESIKEAIEISPKEEYIFEMKRVSEIYNKIYIKE